MKTTSQRYDNLADDIYSHLVEVITGRYRKNADRSIRDVYQLNEDFLHMEEDVIHFVFTYQREIAAILENPDLFANLARLFILSTLEFMYANNQFIRIDSDEEAHLERIYTTYLKDMHKALLENHEYEPLRARFEELIHSHFLDLRGNLARFFDPNVRDETDSSIFKQVVCREYSPVFQLEILGMHLDHIRPPVLDLGCGKTGRLVGYLRSKGIDAHGVDRIVNHADALTAGDWLEYAVAPAAWGTIISHMAFSNHFIYQHYYKNGKPEDYARQYMAILSGLEPGGSFFYSPGLPFIEALLPNGQFNVLRHSISESNSQGRGGALYSTQVVRR
jgi:hypothetical protein